MSMWDRHGTWLSKRQQTKVRKVTRLNKLKDEERRKMGK